MYVFFETSRVALRSSKLAIRLISGTKVAGTWGAPSLVSEMSGNLSPPFCTPSWLYRDNFTFAFPTPHYRLLQYQGRRFSASCRFQFTSRVKYLSRPNRFQIAVVFICVASVFCFIVGMYLLRNYTPRERVFWPSLRSDGCYSCTLDLCPSHPVQE